MDLVGFHEQLMNGIPILSTPPETMVNHGGCRRFFPPSKSRDSPHWELLGDVGFGLGLSEHVEKTHGKTHFDDLQISIYISTLRILNSQFGE